jgi:surface polysaccharide O-acyltransferase-like enzyme
MPVQSPPSALIPELPYKIHYIDTLKVLLTILVVLHHCFITYGAPGGWYYSEKTTQTAAIVPMTIFVSVNQAFFMGFFFFLSAYFITPSYDRKGAARFIGDRLLRLGLPLVFYSFILSPLLSYLVYYFGYGHHITYLQYLGGFHPWIDFGVLWFVAALLLFTLVYVAVRTLVKTGASKPVITPSAGIIVLFAAAVGLVSFLVRTRLPVGWVLKPVGFQPGHFSQYIALFILGLVAYKNNWLNTLTYKTGKQLFFLFLGLLMFFPVFYIIQTKFHMPGEWYSGGFHLQALLYAVWEQVIGFSIITALLVFGRELWNKSSTLLANLSRYTFAVYIFHPLVVISASMLFRDWTIDPALKLLLVAPIAVVGSFLLAWLVVLVPGVKRVI